MLFNTAAYSDYGKLSRPLAGRHDRRRAGRRRALQAEPGRLRALEAVEAGRAGVGEPVRARAARLAHRVLGDDRGDAGPAHRHPRRRQRPDLPAPRERDGAGDLRRPRRRLRQLLAAQRLPEHGRGEDVEEPGQRGAGRTTWSTAAPGEALRWALLAAHYRQPLAWTDEVRRAGARARSTGSMARCGAPRDVDGRPAEPPRRLPRRRWRTTSTRPGPTPSCSRWPSGWRPRPAASAPRPRASCWPPAHLIGFLQADPEAWFQGGADPALKARVEEPDRRRADGPRGARTGPSADRIRAELTALNVEVMDGAAGRDLADQGEGLMALPMKIEHRLGRAGAGGGDLGDDLRHRRAGRPGTRSIPRPRASCVSARG